MGRSVNYLNEAVEVAYFDVSLHTDDEGLIEDYNDSGDIIKREPIDDDYYWIWEDFRGNITSVLKAKYNSLCDVKNSWNNRETKVILENEFIEIGISEYCGLASVSIQVSNEDYAGIATRWIKQNWDNMVKVMSENTYHKCLTKIGTFSNGTSAYEYCER